MTDIWVVKTNSSRSNEAMPYNQLPDTPWHIGYTKKDIDDPRRHKARCIHNLGGVCHCGRSRGNGRKCGGSAHCRFYAETLEQWENIKIDLMTIEEIENERAYEYRRKKIEARKKLEELGFEEINRRYHSAKICPICSGDIKRGSCSYCGFSVSPDDYSKASQIRPAEEEFLKLEKKVKATRRDFAYKVISKLELNGSLDIIPSLDAVDHCYYDDYPLVEQQINLQVKYISDKDPVTTSFIGKHCEACGIYYATSESIIEALSAVKIV